MLQGATLTSDRKLDRIHSLDFMRGLFLIIILVNHIALFPNIFMLVTGKSQLWMSAAEGFMAVSGLLIGYIYTRKMRTEPKKTTKNILKRAFKVYVATILLGIFCMLFIYFIDPTPIQDIHFVKMLQENGLINFIVSIVTLSFAFHWAEFLSNYAIFIALAPLALWLIVKKQAWIVAAVSLVVWYLSLHTPVENTIFVRSSWQIIFFFSVIIGAYFTQIKGFIHGRLSQKQRKNTAYALWIVAAALFAASTILTWGYGFINENILPLSGTPLEAFSSWWWLTGIPEGMAFDKAHLGVLRIAAGILMFWALFTFIEAHLKQLNKITNNFIERIGKNGLSAYIIHSVIALVILALPAIDLGSKIWDLIINTLITALCIYALYFFTYRAPLLIRKAKEYTSGNF